MLTNLRRRTQRKNPTILRPRLRGRLLGNAPPPCRAHGDRLLRARGRLPRLALTDNQSSSFLTAPQCAPKSSALCPTAESYSVYHRVEPFSRFPKEAGGLHRHKSIDG